MELSKVTDLMAPSDFLAGLLEAGFSPDIALGNTLAYAIEYCEVKAMANMNIPHRLTLMASALQLVKEAARDCGIDQAAKEAEWKRQNEEMEERMRPSKSLGQAKYTKLPADITLQLDGKTLARSIHFPPNEQPVGSM